MNVPLHMCAIKFADFAKSDNMILKKPAFRPANRSLSLASDCKN